MSEPPRVKKEDIIYIGRDGGIRAVVSHVYAEPKLNGAVAEVVYDDKGKAINEDVKWVLDHWEFAVPGPGGGYADRYDRLKHFVSILRARSRA